MTKIEMTNPGTTSRVFVILVALNVTVFGAILYVAAERVRSSSRSSSITIIQPGEDVSWIAESNQFITPNFRRIPAKHIVCLFPKDSIEVLLSTFIDDMKKCIGNTNQRVILALFSNNLKRGEMHVQADSDLVVVVGNDARNTLRTSLGIRKEGTIIIENYTMSVQKSFPFLLNPYVLCEELTRLPSK